MLKTRNLPVDAEGVYRENVEGGVSHGGGGREEQCGSH